MTSATGYAVAVETVLTRFRDEQRWWDHRYQQQVRAELLTALEPCPASYIEELLARKDLFPYDGDANEIFRFECDKVLRKKRDAALNPIAELPADVREFLGQEPVPNELLRALAESATLRAEVTRAAQAGFRFGGDVSKSDKVGADEAFTHRRAKKIYIPSSTTDFVRTLVFEIQNALSDEGFRAIETTAREADISAHKDGSAAEFARAVADVEIGNNRRTAEIMRQASTETKLDAEARALPTATDHLRSVVRGKATVQQDYESVYYRILLAKLERFAGTGPDARNQVAALITTVRGKLEEYESLSSATRNPFAD